MVQIHSPPCSFIRMNKRLTHLTILLKSVIVLTIHRIAEPIEA